MHLTPSKVLFILVIFYCVLPMLWMVWNAEPTAKEKEEVREAIPPVPPATQIYVSREEEPPVSASTATYVVIHHQKEEEEEEPLPSFFILGVTKAGTSSLSRHLHAHPSIQAALCLPTADHYCSAKEVTFWGHSYYDSKGLSWYRQQFPRGNVSFDATPSNFYARDAVRRLQAAIQPTQKCVVLLRNPVDRAYSQWQMQQRFLGGQAPTGVTLKKDWELPFMLLMRRQMEAIRDSCGAPPERPHGQAADTYLHCVRADMQYPLEYTYAGLYWVSLRSWQDALPVGQLLILETDEFKAHPVHTLNTVTDFLGLPRFANYPELGLHYNSATSYGPGYSALSSQERAELSAFFQPHNQLLYRMLQRNFGWESLPLPPNLPLSALSDSRINGNGSMLLAEAPSYAQLSLKIYVYPMPSWTFSFQTQKWGYFYCASEMAYYWRLTQRSGVLLTQDPEKADLFFVPGYWSAAIFGETNERKTREYGRKIVLAALQYVKQKWPFWARHSGADHVFLFSYDYSFCMDHRPHRSGESPLANQLREELQQSILLSTLGDVESSCFSYHKDIVIPPMLKEAANLWGGPPFGDRHIKVHFRGRIDVGQGAEMWDPDENPLKSAAKHRVFSQGVRSQVYELYRGRPGWLIEKTSLAYDAYLQELRSSQFCLAMRGHVSWTLRLYESLAYGCIPVIIGDGIVMPFQNLFDWNQVALFVQQKDIASLANILNSITEDESIFMSKNSVKFRGSLLFDPDGNAQSKDAFYWSILELSKHREHFPGTRRPV